MKIPRLPETGRVQGILIRNFLLIGLYKWLCHYCIYNWLTHLTAKTGWGPLCWKKAKSKKPGFFEIICAFAFHFSPNFAKLKKIW